MIKNTIRDKCQSPSDLTPCHSPPCVAKYRSGEIRGRSCSLASFPACLFVHKRFFLVKYCVMCDPQSLIHCIMYKPQQLYDTQNSMKETLFRQMETFEYTVS